MSAEIVFFAIKAGMRLGMEVRQAYIDTTLNRGIMLPRPEGFGSTDVAGAHEFFISEEGQDYVTGRLEELEHIYTGTTDVQRRMFTSEEKAEYLEFYNSAWALEEAKGNKGIVKVEGISAGVDVGSYNDLYKFKNWEQKDREARPFAKIAGTVVEIAVDYFVSVPGAIKKDSKEGKALYSFLEGLDKVEFAGLAASKEVFGAIGQTFFMAVMETVAEQPELITSDEKYQRLITEATTSLSRDISEQLVDIDDTTHRHFVRSWGDLVFRSLLSSAGKIIVNEPSIYFGLAKEGERALVSNIGTAMIDVAVKNETLNLAEVFGRTGFERALKAALKTVGDYPELLVDDDDKGLKGLVADIAKTVSEEENVLNTEFAPELLRIVLEKSGDNLHLLWPDVDKKPEKHLLLVGAKELIEILAADPGQANWTLRFTRDNLLIVIESVMDDLSSNPEWLLAEIENTYLNTAIRETLDVIRQRGDERLSLSLACKILKVASGAVASDLTFIHDYVSTKPYVAAVIDVILAKIFSEEDLGARWKLLKEESVVTALEIGLQAIEKKGLSSDHVDKLERAVESIIKEMKDGKPLDWQNILVKMEV